MNSEEGEMPISRSSQAADSLRKQLVFALSAFLCKILIVKKLPCLVLILALSVVLLVMTIMSLKTMGQRHPFWALYERYFALPTSLICMIFGLCMLPYCVKFVYEFCC